jgi:hypothetical protein
MQGNPRECARWERHFHFKAFWRKADLVYSRNLEGPMSGQEEGEKSTATTVWSQRSTTCGAYRTKPSRKDRHCAGLRLWQRWTLRILLPIERWPHLLLPNIWVLNSTNLTLDSTSTHCRSQRALWVGAPAACNFLQLIWPQLEPQRIFQRALIEDFSKNQIWQNGFGCSTSTLPPLNFQKFKKRTTL